MFSPAPSSQAQITLPQMGTPIVQQPSQMPSLTSTNLVGGLYGNFFSALLTGIWVGFVFFHLGLRAAQRQARHHDRAAVQRQHIQTLEPIWQMSAKRND
jgi:hypothetical protein